MTIVDNKPDATDTFAFDNSYARLPEHFYARLNPTPVREPRMMKFNQRLAEELGLDAKRLDSETGAVMLSGNQLARGAEPIAMAYAGHQFGHFVSQLGDGRAILLGEVIGRDGKRRDIQLKGSGQTPFSRGGDGRAAVGPVIREYIVSEAMHALGIPTTRALAFVTTGEPVLRETALPGAVLTRVASSHIRIGTFEYFAAREDTEAVKILADYAMDRHYPELKAEPNPYSALIEAVLQAQASLIARWMHVGFIHGVMNTDNMTISGETIDYGPCAFMDAYDPATVFSSIDQHGRYAYGNQPRIVQWNLARFAETLLPLLHSDRQQAIAIAEKIINKFHETFECYWLSGMRRKLGLLTVEACDLALVQSLLEVMQKNAVDYTNTFRALCNAVEQPEHHQAWRILLPQTKDWDDWLVRWQVRLRSEQQTPHVRASEMRRVNPAYIPRNHRVEQAINAAVEEGNLSLFEELLVVLSDPYEEQEAFSHYTQPPAPSDRVYQTFCGT